MDELLIPVLCDSKTAYEVGHRFCVVSFSFLFADLDPPKPMLGCTRHSHQMIIHIITYFCPPRNDPKQVKENP